VLTVVSTEAGWFFSADCVAPQAQPLSAIAFFFSFTTLAAFVVLSLFVGTITLGMIDAMAMLQVNEGIPQDSFSPGI